MVMDIRPLSEALAKKAQAELNEEPERSEEAVNILREWISKQPHLKARTDDQFLMAFLRGSKFSLERAKQKIDMYYTLRTAIPDMFKNRDPLDPKLHKIIKRGSMVMLPKTDGPDGTRICLIRPASYNPSDYHIRDVMKVNTMIADIMLIEDDNIIVAGQSGILDLNNVTKEHFLQFDIMLIKQMTMMSQEASPLRQKGFHYVNTPKGFEVVYNLFTKFLNEKNRSRLHVHGYNIEALYEYIPKSLLPTEYGGDAGPLQDIIDNWEKKLLEYRDFFIDDDKYGVDERLRPGKPKTANDLFGVDGTFRKLNLD